MPLIRDEPYFVTRPKARQRLTTNDVRVTRDTFVRFPQVKFEGGAKRYRLLAFTRVGDTVYASPGSR